MTMEYFSSILKTRPLKTFRKLLTGTYYCQGKTWIFQDFSSTLHKFNRTGSQTTKLNFSLNGMNTTYVHNFESFSAL